MDPLAASIIRRLELIPHPLEGGYFRETYRSAQLTGGKGEPARSLATAIFFLLVPGTFSELHCLDSDEIYHFYAGDPVNLLRLHPRGVHDIVRLGRDLEAGEVPQCLVPGGVWQGSCLAEGGRFALMGTTMSPGFTPEEYRRGEAGVLLAGWPAAAALIHPLVR